MFTKIEIAKIAIAFLVGGALGGFGALSVITFIMKKWNVIFYTDNNKIMVTMKIIKKEG